MEDISRTYKNRADMRIWINILILLQQTRHALLCDVEFLEIHACCTSIISRNVIIGQGAITKRSSVFRDRMNDMSVRYSHIGEAEFVSRSLFSSVVNFKMG